MKTGSTPAKFKAAHQRPSEADKLSNVRGASLSRAMLRKEAKRQARIKKRREATNLSNESGDNQ